MWRPGSAGSSAAGCCFDRLERTQPHKLALQVVMKSEFLRRTRAEHRLRRSLSRVVANCTAPEEIRTLAPRIRPVRVTFGKSEGHRERRLSTLRRTSILSRPCVEQLEHVLGQDAADDFDRGERRLGRDFRAGYFDLAQKLAELFDRRAIDYPRDAAVGDGAHAHRTRLARSIDCRVAQDFRAMLGEAVADCDHLAMRGRVLEPLAGVAPARQHPAILDNHCPERCVRSAASAMASRISAISPVVTLLISSPAVAIKRIDRT